MENGYILKIPVHGANEDLWEDLFQKIMEEPVLNAREKALLRNYGLLHLMSFDNFSIGLIL